MVSAKQFRPGRQCGGPLSGLGNAGVELRIFVAIGIGKNVV